MFDMRSKLSTRDNVTRNDLKIKELETEMVVYKSKKEAEVQFLVVDLQKKKEEFMLLQKVVVGLVFAFLFVMFFK